MKRYSISQAAEKYGMEPHTLRFYEKEGILQPQRTPGGVRFYTQEDLTRLEVALCLKNTGMTLKEIRRYFQLVGMGEETLEERLKIFERHYKHIQRERDRMEKALAVIAGKIHRTQQALEARKTK